MKAVEILKEEAKKAGMSELEAVAEQAIKLIFEKVVPRCAIEADEAPVKMVCGFIGMVSPVVEKAALEAAEKIDPNS